MNDRFEHIDNVFYEGLDDLHATPDERAWENIAQQLKENNRKRRLVFLSRAAAIFAFVITLVSGYFVSQHINPSEDIALNETKNANNEVVANTDHLKEQVPEIDNGIHAMDSKEVFDESTEDEKNLNATEPSIKTEDVQTHNSSPPIAVNPELLAQPMDMTKKNDVTSNVVFLNKVENKEALLRTDQEAIHPTFTHLKTNNPKNTITEQNNINPYLDEYAINELKEKNNNIKFQLSGVATPLYTTVESQENTNRQSLAVLTAESGQPEVNEDALSAYTAGLKFSVSKGRRLSVQTGVLYAKVDQRHQFEAFERISVSDEGAAQNNTDRIISQNTAGAAPPQLGFEFAQSQNTQVSEEENTPEFNQYVQTISDDIEYLEIPLSMRYTVIDRKLEVNVLGGMATNFLISGERKTSTSAGVENSADISVALDKIKYSTHVGIGFEYPIYEQLVFVLEPTLKYYMNSLETINQTKVNPFAFGLYTGVNFAF